jgi:hypothetical protein
MMEIASSLLANLSSDSFPLIADMIWDLCKEFLSSGCFKGY